MARKKAHEEHANHEAWAIPYADLMTLLLAFFVVMYAVSSINEGKYKVMAEAITAAFGGPPKSVTPVQAGKTQVSGSDHDRPAPLTRGRISGPAQPTTMDPVTRLSAMASQVDMPLDKGRLQAAKQQLESIATELERALSPLVERKLVLVRRADLWLEVQINSDILFTPGSATLDPMARETLDKLAGVLGDAPNPVRVEGYTDNRPINTYQFPSNWELSAARAASVVHLFSRSGMPQERLAMIGYGEFRPIADNATIEGRNSNRRVLLVILASDQQAGEKSLPHIAAAPADAGSGSAGVAVTATATMPLVDEASGTRNSGGALPASASVQGVQ